MLCPWYATRKASKRQCSPVAVPSRVAPCVNENSTVIRCVSRSSSCLITHDRPCRAALIRDPLTTANMPERMHPAPPCAMRSDNSVFRRLRPIPSPLGRVSGLRSPLARRWTVDGRVDGRAVCGASHKRLPESQNAFPYTALEPSHLRRVSTSWQAALNARKGSRRLAKPYASLPFGASGNAKPPVRFTRHVASMVTSEVTFAMGQGSKRSPRCSIHAYSCALYGAKKSSSMWSSAREERDFLPWFLFIA